MPIGAKMYQQGTSDNADGASKDNKSDKQKDEGDAVEGEVVDK